MNEEIDLKRKLVEATDAVRKKFKQIKSASVHDKIELEKFYEPISTPLTSISNVIKKQKSLKPKYDQISMGTSTESVSTPTQTAFTERAPKETSTPLIKPRKPLWDESSIHRHTLDERFVTPPPSNTSAMTSSDYSVESPDSVIQSYLNEFTAKPSLFDNIYGVRREKKNKYVMYMGKMEIRFPPGNVVLVDKNNKISEFQGNSELYDLLFLRNPPALGNEGEMDPEVIENYKSILQLTEAPYTDYNKKYGLRATRWRKYTSIIKPLMQGTRLGTGIQKNNSKGSLPLQKRVISENVNYVYWNKPKELIDRLRLLWSSKMAGHTGHDNEIISIIEELREERIIY